MQEVSDFINKSLTFFGFNDDIDIKCNNMDNKKRPYKNNKKLGFELWFRQYQLIQNLNTLLRVN